MSTGVTAALFVDGVRFQDGTVPGYTAGDPVALSGLTVNWGRDTTVDQPGASSCTFEVADSQGGVTFQSLLRTGAAVEVAATGVDYPEPTLPTFLDPSFEADPLAYKGTNAIVGPSTSTAHSGSRSMLVRPEDGTRRWSVLLPPAPFSPHGAEPGAWDAIPQTSPGQTWSAGIWVHAPYFAQVAVQPVLFTGPWDDHWQTVGAPAPLIDGTGDWQLAQTTVNTAATGSWVGLLVSGYPTGVPWDKATGTWDEQIGSWDDREGVYLDDATVLAPDGGTTRTVLVFAGRITGLQAQWDDAIAGPKVNVVANDFLADLANRDVGDEPWAVEPMGDRFNRILALSGLSVAADIDPVLYPTPVTWLDVDNQPAASLLSDLAVTVDGVMWSAVHQTTGAYLKVEDPSARAALYRLEMVDGVVVITRIGEGHALSACDVLRDPIEFTQDVSDVVTRAAVSWLEQGAPDAEGKVQTVQHTETVIDADLESELGTRRISTTTQLIAAPDAIDMANRQLARLSAGGWRASGVVVDDVVLDSPTQMLGLLDGTSRIGLPVRVTEMPEWSPAGSEVPLYVEGGKYHYEVGRWILDLNVSSARGLGTSVVWDELPADWSWDEFDRSVTWDDLFGVSAPAAP